MWGRGGDDKSAKEHLEQQQALVKQLAEILDFVHKFDDLKLIIMIFYLGHFAKSSVFL